jgi:PadR family transcriptional regulator PadR
MTNLPLLKGTLDVLVLKALAWSPMHGFELTRWLADRSGAEFEFEEAAVYQSLYRLEARRLIVAEWGISERGRRARYYQLTPAGRAHYRKESALWRRYAQVVTGILDAADQT